MFAITMHVAVISETRTGAAAEEGERTQDDAGVAAAVNAGTAALRRSNQVLMAAKRPAKLVVTNPDRVLYPGGSFTKAQVVDNYVGISPVLLPHFAEALPRGRARRVAPGAGARLRAAAARDISRAARR
ncbi:MAG: hypothetical protein M3Y80_02815 [Verrucomicrobiota bacterium]|nr:hypothetical protein [Verrucomicrobiota bacterium]